MRFRVSVVLLLLLILPTTFANATTLIPITPGIGDPDIFRFFGGQVTISATGVLNVELKFNYPGSVLGPISDPALGAGFNWYPGDLLFTSGSDMFGIPLATHSVFSLAAPPTVLPIVTAFDVYQATAFQTADQVLAGFPLVDHRPGPTAFVWLGDTPVLLSSGPLPSNVHFTGDASIGLFDVTIINGQLPPNFTADVNAHGFSVSFASTICDNGGGDGSDGPPPPPVPEPASLVLLATGFLGVSSVVRHRISGSK